MPGLRVAVASGNWSNTATWNGGVLPAAGDTVASNGFTVTIDQNVNISLISNGVLSPLSTIPVMTGYTTPSGTAAASNSFDTNTYAAWRAFDGSSSSTYWLTTNGTTTGWLSYQFPSSKIITQYGLYGSYGASNYFPKNWTFEAYDGSSWIVLETVTNYSGNNYSSNITNTTAYTTYRINITANQGATSVSVGEFFMGEGNYSMVSSIAGGGFTLNSGVTVTCTAATAGIIPGTATCLTYSGTGTATINSNIGTSTSAVSTILFNSAGVLNLNGTLINPYTSVGARYLVTVSSSGTLNYAGTNYGMQISYGIYVSGSNSTINHIGSLYGSQNGGCLYIVGNSVNVNVTGTIYQNQGGSTGSGVIQIQGSNCIMNITGNIGYTSLVTAAVQNCLLINTAATVNITGNIYGNAGGSSYTPIYTTTNTYLKITGVIYAGSSYPSVVSTSGSAINIFTGPFVSYESGIFPFYVSRMHLFRTLNAYIEYRDNSTNGAVPPAAAAPATRMVSADSIVDAPAISNVRAGVTFALSTLTGTCAIPVASNVSKDTVYDNGTVGTAYIEGTQIASEIWNKLTSDLTVSGSIGERLKNVATVQSTGQQIAAFKI